VSFYLLVKSSVWSFIPSDAQPYLISLIHVEWVI